VLALVGVQAEAETPAYAWSLVSATAPPATMHPGAKVTLAVTVRNEGTATWQAEGPNPVRLGATSPRERVSAFASQDPTWLQDGRRVRMTTPVARPGEVASFAFTFTAPEADSYPAPFDEHFAPVAGDAAWMDATTVRFTTTVRPASSNIPAIPNPPVPSPPPAPTPTPPIDASIDPCESGGTTAADAWPPAAAAGYGGGTTVAGGLQSPRAVTIDPLGRLLVAEPSRIARFDTSGAAFGSFGEGLLTDATGVAAAPTGRVYVTDAASGRVEIFSIAGVHVGGFGGLDDPQDVASAADGSVVVAEAGAARIAVFTTSGLLLADTQGELSYPTAVAVHSNRVYVADTGNDRVRRFTLDGTQDGEWGGPGCLASPQGVSVSDHGVFVADTGHARVVQFSRTGTKIAEFGAEALRGLRASGGTVYGTDPGAGTLRRYTPAAQAAPPVPCPDPSSCVPQP
jgi:sugar lactone lactonase YvrE